MITSTEQDTIIRMALASMAADKTSSLTQTQRQWIIDLTGQLAALTAAQRSKLRTPLLEWVAARQPRILDIVTAQFKEQP